LPNYKQDLSNAYKVARRMTQIDVDMIKKI